MSKPSITAVDQRDTVRLVSAGYLDEPALAPLASDAEALEDLAELEGATNDRLRAQQTGLSDLDPRELVFGRQGYTYINAAFTHTRPTGNRFNDAARGAWYCAFEASTSLAEVSFHITRELEAIHRFDNVSRYGELRADFRGPFHDLRVGPAGQSALHPEIAIGYPAGQRLARELRRKANSNGIVYPSVRRESGTCLACFRPDMVQNVRRGETWELVWSGSPDPDIAQVR